MSDQAVPSGGLSHVAWFYRTASEYVTGIQHYLQAAVSAGEPVLLAVPSGQPLASWSEPDGAAVYWLDSGHIGRNPARILSALRTFADKHAPGPVRVLCELAWTGRSPAELGEVARYETGVNLALRAAPVRIVCPYNVTGLPSSAISAACASHPRVRQQGHESDSSDYMPAHEQVVASPPLLAPPGAQSLAYARDLRPVRTLVAAAAGSAGLSAARRTDLVIAASEVAANTLKHTGGGGVVRVWLTSDEVLCQLEDGGHIADPLAGYGRPTGDVLGGQGLWLVNQVCDLAEIRTSLLGTTIRLHMSRDAGWTGSPPGQRTGQGCVT